MNKASSAPLHLHPEDDDRNHPRGRRQIRYGQLNLVDLAGSSASRGPAHGRARARGGEHQPEPLTLGRVINALVDPTTSHVPYRDSKLTRLLQSPSAAAPRRALWRPFRRRRAPRTSTVDAQLRGHGQGREEHPRHQQPHVRRTVRRSIPTRWTSCASCCSRS